MGEIVNLRRVKKQLARQDAADAARENRVRHGRTATERRNAAEQKARRLTLLEGKRVESDSRARTD